MIEDMFDKIFFNAKCNQKYQKLDAICNLVASVNSVET
jgi:hypothetical protein